MTSVASGLGQLEGGITSPLVGWLADRYGPKWLVFTGVGLAGGGLILMSFIASTAQYLVVWGLVVGVGLNVGLTVAVDKSLNDWFVLKRGLAQGTKFALIGVGGIIALPIVTLLVTHFGWRTACLVWGFLLLSLSPLALIFVKQRRPEHYGLLPDGAKVPPQSENPSSPAAAMVSTPAFEGLEIEFTFREAIRTRTYWLMAAAFTCQMLILGGINIHIIPFLTDIGIDRAQASAMMGMMVFFTIPARFFSGFAADLVGKNRLHLLLFAGYLAQAVGLTTFLLSRSLASVYVFLACYGLSAGAGTPLFILILARYFGRKAFGSIFGGSMALRAPVALFAPVFSGWVFDTTGSYVRAFSVFAFLALIAASIMFFVRPAAPPHNKTAG
jgi:MFS family permease